MGLDGILFYCLRAGRFALTVGAVYAALRILAVCRGRAKPQPERFALQLTAVCYLAALTEIVALRGLTVTGRSVQWLPLGTIGPLAAEFVQTVGKPLRLGLADFDLIARKAWPLVYHVAGNLVWFVPLGLLGALLCAAPGSRLPDLRRPGVALAAGAVVSFALELTQFVLATGASDLDDILLNALGALLGWGVWRLGHALRQKGR